MKLHKIILYLTIIFLISCQTKKNLTSTLEVSILNEAFMDMIGTIPYKYHSLRPAPNDSIYLTTDTLNVAITPYLTNIRNWKRDISAWSDDIKGEDGRHIIALFEKSERDSLPIAFATSQFKNTGRYKLFPYAKKSISIDTLSAIGKLSFSRTYFDDVYAITVATIRDHIKNGIVKLFLLEKRSGVWCKKEEYILEIW
ncbi:MAG TPA: hypothetical protein VF408_07095 [Sediminibacterium sp.]|jgi:hypothetical protein